MRIFRQTFIEIDISVIAQNTRLLRRRIPKSARLMAVVKADGYGHGAARVAEAALENGADCLGVSTPEEGAQLRLSGTQAPILILGGISREGAEAVARFSLAQTVFDEGTVRFLSEAAAKERTPLDVHIKVDTGMGRIGVRGAGELGDVAQAVLRSPSLCLAGVFTHFADADNENAAFTDLQANRFLSLAGPLKAQNPALLLHAANSAAALRFPEYALDMVRIGLALYTAPDLPARAGEDLGEALRWVTQAVHVKTIEPGEAVGYGLAFAARRKTRVMTIPVGYGDGYHRAIGNRGRALVRGQSAPVIGRVCMDQAMLDVTDVPGAEPGDEVVLLGRQGAERITPREMARWCDMIDYEILLSPTPRVPRVYVESREPMPLHEP